MGVDCRQWSEVAGFDPRFGRSVVDIDKKPARRLVEIKFGGLVLFGQIGDKTVADRAVVIYFDQAVALRLVAPFTTAVQTVFPPGAGDGGGGHDFDMVDVVAAVFVVVAVQGRHVGERSEQVEDFIGVGDFVGGEVHAGPLTRTGGEVRRQGHVAGDEDRGFRVEAGEIVCEPFEHGLVGERMPVVGMRLGWLKITDGIEDGEVCTANIGAIVGGAGAFAGQLATAHLVVAVAV